MFLEDSVILDSDEEWCDDCTKVNNLEVMNFSHPKDCSSRGLEPPSKYLGALFRPVVCSLNNKINFVAISGKTYQHKTEIDRFCGLQPACPVRFGEGTVIARVYIMETVSHPRNNAEDWVCAHHGIASVKGFKLQTQFKIKKIKHTEKYEAADKEPDVMKDKATAKEQGTGKEADVVKDDVIAKDQVAKKDQAVKKDQLTGISPLKQREKRRNQALKKDPRK